MPREGASREGLCLPSERPVTLQVSAQGPKAPPTTWRLTGRHKHSSRAAGGKPVNWSNSGLRLPTCISASLLLPHIEADEEESEADEEESEADEEESEADEKKHNQKTDGVVGSTREAQPVDLPKSAYLALLPFLQNNNHYYYPATMEVFIFPRPVWLSWLYDSSLVHSFSNLTNLPSLPFHIHHVLGAFLVYHTIFLFISPIISTLLLPNIYPKFNKRTRINWDVHVVSFVQSSFICTFALWVMYTDTQRAAWRSQDEEGMLGRVFGYTTASGAVQGYAAGYFLWDLVMSAWYLEIFGPGFLAHAASAVAVYNLGFRPFVNFYAPIFVLFELSSPFLNIHWFCDKVGLTGSRTQFINGIFLLGMFFSCRVIYGTWSSYLVMTDVFNLYRSPPAVLSMTSKDMHADQLVGDAMVPHPFAGKSVPLWLACVYLGSNSILNLLNYYWFTKMIQTVASRFTGDKKGGRERKVAVGGDEVKVATGVEKMEVRKRT